MKELPRADMACPAQNFQKSELKLPEGVGALVLAVELGIAGFLTAKVVEILYHAVSV